jgi:hypothetical protein
MSEKKKSIGMAVYVAIGTVTTFTELCTVDVPSGNGAEASVIELEPCLNETEIEQTVDLAKDTPIEMQYKKMVGTATTVISEQLVAAVKARSTVKLGIAYPGSTTVYGRRDGYLVSHNDDAVSRGEYLTCSMSFLPTSAMSYSTTAPATA